MILAVSSSASNKTWFSEILVCGLMLARKGISKRYEEIKTTAEVIETIVNAGKDRRLKLLTKYARNNIPEVSVCAINIMGGLADESIFEYLRDFLSSGDLCIAGQLAVDEVLSDAQNGEIWQRSSISDIKAVVFSHYPNTGVIPKCCSGY